MLTSVVSALLILTTTLIIESVAKSGIVCNEAKFHLPYVKVRQRFGGNDIDSLVETGFIDLSTRYNVILCINGPAVLLTEHSQVQTGNATLDIFTSPEFDIHVHNCTKVNKVPENVMQKLQKPGQALVMTKDVVISNRVVGVNLIGKETDYTLPERKWFLHEDYGHSIHTNNIVHDGSFAVVGQGKHCLKVNNEFNVILVSKAATQKEICLWTVDHNAEFFERYEAIFRGNYTTDQYVWEDCPPDPVVVPSQPVQPSPVTNAEPFSIFDPTGNRPEGGGTGGGSGKKPQIKIQYRVELEDCYTFLPFANDGCSPPRTFPYKGITDQDGKECELLTSVLPLDGRKTFEQGTGWRTEILEIISEIFSQVCEAFPPHMPYTVMRILEFYWWWHDESPPNPPANQNKSQIWDFILTDLRLCRKNTKHPIEFTWMYTDLPAPGDSGGTKKTIGKKKRSIEVDKPEEMEFDDRLEFLSENLLNPSQTSNPYVGFFPDMLMDDSLLEFLEEDADPTLREKKQVTSNSEYYEEVTRNPAYNFLAYPVNVSVIVKSKDDGFEEAVPLFYFEDTAESKYEFNIAIDMAWKIWATVAGHCNQYYHPREAETFPRFYNQFSQEFLKPVEEDWLYPVEEDNDILQILLNDWNSDIALRWLDTCLEGSYVESETPTFRPPRPILVNGQKAKMKPNGFVDLPAYQKAKYEKLYRMRNSPILET